MTHNRGKISKGKPIDWARFSQNKTHKGAVINYGREGGGSISENSQKNFKPPPVQDIKIQTPSRFQRIISDPNTIK